MRGFIHVDMADRIIMILEREQEISTTHLVDLIGADIRTVRSVLGFLLNFKLIEYDQNLDLIRLNPDLAAISKMSD